MKSMNTKMLGAYLKKTYAQKFVLLVISGKIYENILKNL